MGTREGNVNDIPKDQLQTEAIKVFFQIDLIFFSLLSLFVYFYIQMTPFSRNWIGVGGFVFTVLVNIIFTFSLITSPKEHVRSELFQRYNFIKTQYLVSSLSKANDTFLFLSFAIVWIFALFFTPQNLYTAEFRKNAISWLDEGKCSEIKKYDADVFSFCSENISQVRKNVDGEFIVTSKNLTSNAIGCTYGLHSNNKGVDIFTVRPQTCDIVNGQKVSISLHFFQRTQDSMSGDVYNYFLQISPIK